MLPQKQILEILSTIYAQEKHPKYDVQWAMFKKTFLFLSENRRVIQSLNYKVEREVGHCRGNPWQSNYIASSTLYLNIEFYGNGRNLDLTFDFNSLVRFQKRCRVFQRLRCLVHQIQSKKSCSELTTT